MRYAEYRVASRLTSAGNSTVVTKRPERDIVDLVREVARTERYWVLSPESGGTWTLRQFDDTTGLLGEAEYTSGPIGEDRQAAVAWAENLVDVRRWQSMFRPYPGAYIDHLYSLVRDIARQPRPGRSIVVRIESDPSLPGVPLLTVRERWSATNLESDPVYSCEYSGFADETDMLRQVSSWFGLDPEGWTTITAGVAYHHA